MTPGCREEVFQWQEPFPWPSSYPEFYINTKKHELSGKRPMGANGFPLYPMFMAYKVLTRHQGGIDKKQS